MNFSFQEIENETIEGVDFTSETPADAYLNCQFSSCNFQEVDLDKIRFEECAFENCNLSLASLTDARISFSSFTNCKMLGINWSHTKSLREVRFIDCQLDSSSFTGLDLSHGSFMGSSLRSVDFTDAKLQQVDFRTCRFEASIIEGCDLRKADFRNARDYAFSPVDNLIQSAKFSQPEVLNLLSFLGIEIE